MTGPLDPAQDPDRFDASREPEPPSPLDPALDPDRFHSPTLPGLLGDSAGDDARDVWQTLAGLAGILLFLGLVTALAYLH